MALNPSQVTTLIRRSRHERPDVRRGRGGAGTIAAALALFAAAPAAAQPVPAPQMADVAMRVCIRANPDASAGVQAEGFSVRSRVGRTYVYEHEAGPTMTLTSRPGFFNCDIEMPDAEPGYLDGLLSELRTDIERRFGAVNAHRAEDGMRWQFTTDSDVVVLIDVAERDDGVVAISSSADAAPLTPPTQ